MAEKHKSKYKAPKDLEKSQKPKPRKDLKDYSEDDKKGALNPKSTGEKQSNVLRKTDKEVIDNGDMFVKYNADDRLYKDLEDGEYDPKHAAKVLKKRQDADEKDTAKNIKDKIENLTREGKERFVREYIRRKINILLEQPTNDAPSVEEDPTAPAPEEPTAPATDVPPATNVPPATDVPAPTDTTAPATDTATPTETNSNDYSGIIDTIANKENTVFRVNALTDIINGTAEKLQPKQRESLLRLLKIQVVKLDRSLNTNKEK
jgi:hypothetical protein